jgi:hypothetical protein
MSNAQKKNGIEKQDERFYWPDTVLDISSVSVWEMLIKSQFVPLREPDCTVNIIY